MVSAPAMLRRRWAWLAGAALAAALLLTLARRPLAGMAVGSALRIAGAGEVGFSVVEASPWALELGGVGFRLKTQRFEANRVTVRRDHWWSPTLGNLEVTGLRLPVTIDGSDINPWAWAVYQGQSPAISLPAVIRLPVEQLRLQGQIVVMAAALADRPVEVRLEAHRRAGGDGWEARLGAAAPGLGFQADGRYEPGTDHLDFHVTEAGLDLAAWQDHVQRLVLLPGGSWEMTGRLSGLAEGHYAGKQRALTGQVRVGDGRLVNAARGVTFDGISADWEFTDLLQFHSKPGSVRVREWRTGELVLTDLDLTVAFEGTERVAVSRATLAAFGGHLTAEPFQVYPAQQELEAVLVAHGLELEQILAATREVPARATGRVDGRLPVRLDSAGLRLGPGWLELQRGGRAGIQFAAPGLLTHGLLPGGARYGLLRKIESGLLRLRLDELRLDNRPPGGPPGRMAVLHLVGEPEGPGAEAPVVLEMNINGPIEQSLNLGPDRSGRIHSGR